MKSLHFPILIVLVSALGFTALERGYSASSDLITHGRLKKEALFNDQIPASTLAEALEAEGLDVSTAVENAVRMTPGTHFTTVGDIGSFDYFPEAYQGRHAVMYYIPNSLKGSLYGKSPDIAPVLFLWHGGGAKSTNTYEGAKQSASLYISLFVNFAEASKTILIASSTSRWNAHACSFLTRELTALARKELNVSGNRFYLFGHSMGAMGMTRSTGTLADEFAGFLATAAGMEDWARSEENLRPYLNTTFTHINGEVDRFFTFKPRLIATEKKLKEIAAKYQMPLRYKALFHSGGHDFDIGMTLAELNRLFEVRRDLYQPRLFSYMGRGYLPETSSLPQIKNFIYPHYFWARAAEMEDPAAGRGSAYAFWNFELDRKNNAIVLTPFTDAENLKSVDLLISRQMLDLSQPVKVMIGDKVVKEELVRPDPVKTIEIARSRGDAQFLFDNVIRVATTAQQDEAVTPDQPKPPKKKPTYRRKKKKRFGLF